MTTFTHSPTSSHNSIFSHIQSSPSCLTKSLDTFNFILLKSTIAQDNFNKSYSLIYLTSQMNIFNFLSFVVFRKTINKTQNLYETPRHLPLPIVQKTTLHSKQSLFVPTQNQLRLQKQKQKVTRSHLQTKSPIQKYSRTIITTQVP